jgi:hypothetical protein
MKKLVPLLFISLLFSILCTAQAIAVSSLPPDSLTSKKGLFESSEILHVTMKGDFRKILNNREGEAKYYPVSLTFSDENNKAVSIPIKVKTRGHFRRERSNCTYPPLLLSFPAATADSSFFPQASSLKLVMPCRGEEFIVHEWLVYRLYNLITPQSFRARLVLVNLEQLNNKKMPSPFYGILLEEEKQMAKRNNMVLVKRKIKPAQTVTQSFLRMAVFEYLIGNTDWSVEFLQNIKLIAADSVAEAITVPYDFDLSGIVNSPYAQPAPELAMASVRQRRYRGYCIKDMSFFDSTIALYNRLKPAIYDLYTKCSLIDDNYKKATIEYLDEFYTIINDPKKLQKEFGYPCNPAGTGNVIIKGLRED